MCPRGQQREKSWKLKELSRELFKDKISLEFESSHVITQNKLTEKKMAQCLYNVSLKLTSIQSKIIRQVKKEENITLYL